MKKISNGFVVEINYIMTNKEGVLLDSTKETGPLIYIHGKENIVSGLEKELEGKKAGYKFNAVVPPEKAYKLINKDLIQSVPKNNFGTDSDIIQVGMQFEVQNENGQELVATAVKINEIDIILDGNHPLAGQTLIFDGEVISLREATKDELENGLPTQKTGGCSCC
jgi:FKBP-type peptidyl-prolyl cis-trans isomerase SlyD